MSKGNRAVHEPGWGEVILGAILSLLLGAILASVVLIIRPVVPVKELPKPEDRKRDAVYYVEGSRDTSKARQALDKRKAFVAGQTVTVTEDEINVVLAGDKPAEQAKAAAPKAPAPKGGEKKDAKKAEPEPAAAAPDTGEMVAVGTPNVRVREGVVQLAAPVTFNLLGVSHKVVAQTRGGIVKKGDMFTYEPNEIYVASLPMARIPGLSSYVRNKILTAKPVPEDLATAWKNLKDVAVDGNVVRLSP